MRINGKEYRTIWFDEKNSEVKINLDKNDIPIAVYSKPILDTNH